MISEAPVLEIEYSGYRGRRTNVIWEDKKLYSRRSWGDQTTWGINKIQEAERGQNWNIHIKLEFRPSSPEISEQFSKLASERKITRFFGGPNGPKFFGRRTKTDFKHRVWGQKILICINWYQIKKNKYRSISLREKKFSSLRGCVVQQYARLPKNSLERQFAKLRNNNQKDLQVVWNDSLQNIYSMMI